MKKSTLKYLHVIALLLTTYCAKAIDYYWVGGTGNWSDYTNHWSTTSGGLPNATHFPGIGDGAYFDINSFSAAGQTIYVDTNAEVNILDFDGALFNPVITSLSSAFFQ